MRRKQKPDVHAACLAHAQKQIDKQRPGVVITQEMLMNFNTGAARMSGPSLRVHWADGERKRGKSLPVVFCLYCPFCGKLSSESVKTKRAKGSRK